MITASPNNEQPQPPQTDGDTEPSLTSRVVRGGVWVFVGKVASRGLQMVKYVVLARLLVPEDFGLFGIVMLALAAAETFTQTGFQTALIQKQRDTEEYLDTAWTVQVVRGFVLAGALFAAAPFVAWFFDEPRVVPLLRLLSAMEVLRGFSNIGILYFQKELEFHKQVAYQLISSAVALAVGVVLAWQLRNVWALVWGSLAGQLTSTALSYVFHAYRPRVQLDRTQATELFGFGRWVLGSTIVVFVSTRVDQAVLGRVLGAAALGVYAMAHQIADLPATEITHLTNSVMMPTYAKLQSDRRLLGDAFLQVFEIIMSLVIPLTTFLIAAAPQIVLGLLGAQWAAAVLPLRILAVAGMLRAAAATAGPLFVGAGHPHLNFWMNLARALVIATLTYPLTREFGVPGTSAAVALALAATIPMWARVRRITGLPWWTIVRSSGQGLLLAAPVALAVTAVQLLAPGASSLALLVLQVASSGLLCVASVAVSTQWFDRGLAVFAVKAWRAIRIV